MSFWGWLGCDFGLSGNSSVSRAVFYGLVFGVVCGVGVMAQMGGIAGCVCVVFGR